MRLIDADELIKDRVENDLVVIAVKCALTAYDVDKVMEQLAAESERWKESGEAYEDQKELGVAEGFKKAIEIVKSGVIG